MRVNANPCSVAEDQVLFVNLKIARCTLDAACSLLGLFLHWAVICQNDALQIDYAWEA